MNEVNLETITPIPGNANIPPRYTTSIAKTREVFILAEKRDTADYKNFSDGSGHDNGVGAVAILKKDRASLLKSLKFYLGPPTQHNTYEVETVGAILAAWIIKNTPEMLGKRVLHYINSQATIMSLNSSKTTSGQYLIEDFQRATTSYNVI